ncbi:MAG: cellulase family glycosylhydrolase [Pirellulales bacterium]|nr:cellulase family glycosylhydrolase [Pirellulales bacterium]
MKYGIAGLALAVLLVLPLPVSGQDAAGRKPAGLPKPSADKLPRWRGFNLLEKFQRSQSGPFQEGDFRLIQELGFNFVRLPMDYRSWIQGDDWTAFNKASLQEIDQAVAWGGKYGIHVLINFHRAPGYTVARPAEAKSLWTDPEAQQVCAMHWGMFARRYRGIPNQRLSFNLFNEPANVEPAVYVEVVKKIAVAIRAEDPDRLIVSDGLEWGRLPILELAELKIAQATRGYTPMDITHYKASWVSGSDQYPLPTWPRPQAYGTLYAPHKGGMKPESLKPLVIEGPLETETVLRLHVMTVSSQATLVAKADGEKIWEKRFQCGPGEGEWKKSEFEPQWKIYRATYDRDYEVPVPAGARRVEVAVTQGDWLKLSEIGLKRAGKAEDVLTLRADWNEPPAAVGYAPASVGSPFVSGTMENRRWLWETMIVPWKDAQTKGIGVMVGEFGAFNQTPHDVVLAWMEDCLANWREAGFGWALWNFRGSFGILNSGRKDVDYEDFHGHKLDRKMLELLQKY